MGITAHNFHSKISHKDYTHIHIRQIVSILVINVVEVAIVTATVVMNFVRNMLGSRQEGHSKDNRQEGSGVRGKKGLDTPKSGQFYRGSHTGHNKRAEVQQPVSYALHLAPVVLSLLGAAALLLTRTRWWQGSCQHLMKREDNVYTGPSKF